MATEIDSFKQVSDQGRLTVGPFQLNSRLIVGSGRYENATVMKECPELSGAQCITVAVRRERLHDADGENLLDFIDSEKYILLLQYSRLLQPRLMRYELPRWDVKSYGHWGIRGRLGQT